MLHLIPSDSLFVPGKKPFVHKRRESRTIETAEETLHFTLDGFDADHILEKLTSHGLTGSMRRRGDTKELMFTDPDNIRVQLQDVSYTGGVGPLGNRYPN